MKKIISGEGQIIQIWPFCFRKSVHMSIKAIYFDLGNVLVSFDWRKQVSEMTANSAVPENRIMELITQSGLAMEFEKGKINSAMFFEKLRWEIGFKDSSEKLKLLWCDIFHPIHEHIVLAKELSRRYPLGIISNTNEAHVDWIDHQFDFLKYFNMRVFSFQSGFLKPQKEIYESALSRLKITPSEALFIDDLELNVKGAQALGWNAIHLKEGMNLRKEFHRLHVM